MIQSAPPGSTVPRSRSPWNVPPATRPMRRLPFGVAPIACMPETARVSVIKCKVRISPMRTPSVSLRRITPDPPVGRKRRSA